MLVDPQMLTEMAFKTSSSAVAPIPTVVPGPEVHHVKAGDIGNRTLW